MRDGVYRRHTLFSTGEDCLLPARLCLTFAFLVNLPAACRYTLHCPPPPSFSSLSCTYVACRGKGGEEKEKEKGKGNGYE